MKILKYILPAFILLAVSCASNPYLLSDKGSEKTYLSNYISQLQKDRKVFKHPLVIVDGKPYRYDVELRNKKLPITSADIKTIRVVDWSKAKKVYGDAATDGAVVISTQISPDLLKDTFEPDASILILVDGKESSIEEMNLLNPQKIKEVEIIKDKETLKKYTLKNYEGVILIHLKE